jgi:cytochrome c-type biogenesis protein CcmH
MLARSYTALGRYADANTAYARAVALRPDDAQLLADHADTAAMLQGKRLAGAPAALIQRALQVDPDNLKALALAGTEAYERGDFAKAADYWQRLRKLVPAGSELESSVDANVQEARALAAGRNPRQVTQGRPAAGSGPDASAAAGHIAGTVRLSPSIAARASPEDTVFIFARATEGPRMPLAILRRQVRDLPASFALDDSLAMAPTLRLSGFREVVVGARVSRSGNAMPQAGDLEGTVRPVRVGATNVEIVIDAAVP